MKKFILSHIILVLYLSGIAQVTISDGGSWVNNGNVTVTIQNMNFVSNGNFHAGTSSIKFTGNLNSDINGNNLPLFSILEIAKTNGAKVLLNRNISINSSLNFISGQLDLNGNKIMMNSSAMISGESESNRIIGANGGFVEITQDINAPVSWNAGNLGATITSSVNLGSVTIRRGHTAQSGTGLVNSIDRYYQIIPANNSNLNATLRLKYFDAELNGQNEASLVMYQSTNDGTSWNNLSRTTNSTNANYVEKAGIGSLSLQTLSNNVQISNGVTGLVFTGTRKKATEVQLKWTTQTETNMSQYQIQRKLDIELDFSDQASINSLAPGGNSIYPLSYQNVDANAHTGNSYYRLKIIVADNSFTYSDIIIVAGKTKGKGSGNNNLIVSDEEILSGKAMNSFSTVSKITVGPNPNNGYFWFSVNGIEKETTATLYTIDGKLINQFRVMNLQRQQVNGLRSGFYLLKIPGFETQKIVVNGQGMNAPITQQSVFDKTKL